MDRSIDFYARLVVRRYHERPSRLPYILVCDGRYSMVMVGDLMNTASCIEFLNRLSYLTS